MKDCDIFRGVKTYSDPCYIFSWVKTPNPNDLCLSLSVCFTVVHLCIVFLALHVFFCLYVCVLWICSRDKGIDWLITATCYI